MANYVRSDITMIHQDDSPQKLSLIETLRETGICEYYWSKHRKELEDADISNEIQYSSSAFSIEIEMSVWGSYINFESKWAPIHPKFIKLLNRDLGDFLYEWEEEQGYGEEYSCKDGVMTLREEWSIPQWEELELPTGDYLYLLTEPWRDIPQGYYADSYTDLDYFYSNDLDEAIRMHTENNNI